MPPPEGKVFDFKPTLKRYAFLLEDTRYGEVQEQTLDEQVFQRLLYTAADGINIDEENMFALRELITTYYGKPLNINTLDEIKWRLAAGAPMLNRGQRLSATFTPGEPEWVALRIEDVRHATTKNNKPMLDIIFRILEGRYAGLSFTQLIAYRFFMGKVARDLGFPIFKRVNKSELTQCWLGGLISVDNENRPQLTEFCAPTRAINFNRKLRKERKEPCVRDYEWSKELKNKEISPCSYCIIGHGHVEGAYGENVPCPRAMHLSPFHRKECVRCGKDSYFDPSKPSAICVTCINKEAYSRIKIASRL